VPLSSIRRFDLKALVVCFCALALAVPVSVAISGTATAIASNSAERAPVRQEARSLSLDQKLALKLRQARKHRSTIRFFETHRSLMRSGDQRAVAIGALRRARRGLATATKEIAYYRALISARAEHERARRLAKAPPRVAICGVFGEYCQQALDVAWCESRWSTDAENGQYRGLFQMGSSERRLFGHGSTAHEQAVAAHRYFVNSGRDWSPWSCRWAVS
jgi:hypothetical protein